MNTFLKEGIRIIKEFTPMAGQILSFTTRPF